jgi:MarR family transcriptional regulator, organic hydroperoxide resistance regulator
MTLRIDDCLGFLLAKAYQQVHQEMKRRLAPYGLTPVQYSVLKGLWERNGRSGAELGARLVLDSATVTGILDRLQQAGLVERRPDRADRRVNRVHLTDAGRRLERPCDAEMEAMNADVLGRFDPEDARRLIGFLTALATVGAAR